ncbi:MAG: GNAT family N-acetyltransferase [Candidatus Limnocylindrales bacterium]
MPDGRGWAIREYVPGDRAAILELHERVFGTPLTAEQWDWQFIRRPFGPGPIIWLATTDDGRVVGHYSEIEVPIWRDRQVTPGAFSIMSMVDPDFQRQGILRALAERAGPELVRRSITMSIAFLNDNSFPLYTQRLGWRPIEPTVPIHVSVLDAGPIAARALRVRPLARIAAVAARPLARVVFRAPHDRGDDGLVVTEVSAVDERFDGLWAAVRQGVAQATDRSAVYLTWRYLESPRTYHLDIAEEGGRLLGYIVTRAEDRFGMRVGHIVELVVDPGRVDVGDLLVMRARRRFGEEGCALATALAPSAGGVRATLERGGFRRLPGRLMPHGIRACVIDRSSRTGDLAASDGWFLSWGDHDVG